MYGIWGKKRPRCSVINMIINRLLTFPFVDMIWLDSDAKYHIMLGVLLGDNHHV